MIETEQSVIVAAPIERVWEHARNIEGWASIMPGYQTCEIVNDDDSRWVLKVGMGGLVRTVNVAVHVEKWDGPGRVDFSYKLEGDPVSGGGSYIASANGNQTEMKLHVKVVGSGPVAPMWEAMGAPLLPTFAKGFAEQLKAKIESAVGSAPQAAASNANPFAAFAAWLRNFWRSITGQPKEKNP